MNVDAVELARAPERRSLDVDDAPARRLFDPGTGALVHRLARRSQREAGLGDEAPVSGRAAELGSVVEGMRHSADRLLDGIARFRTTQKGAEPRRGLGL